MAMVYTGARGKTAEEIAKVLHFTLPQEEVAPAFQSLLATLPGANHPGLHVDGRQPALGPARLWFPGAVRDDHARSLWRRTCRSRLR